MIEQALEFRPAVVVVTDPEARAVVADALPTTEVVADLADMVGFADVVVNGVVGFAGLPVTIETLRAGKRLALANKESLIAAGPIVQPLRSTPGAELVPVDSEHCALAPMPAFLRRLRPGGRPLGDHGERWPVPWSNRRRPGVR